jgi:hypothetical protein
LVKLCLDRGLVAPSSGAGHPLERHSASLGGWTPPRAWSCLDRELNTPLARFRLARGPHGPATSIPAPPTRALNALTCAGAQVKDESTPRRAWESRLGTVPQTLPVRPFPPLCDVVRHGQRQSCGTVPPTPVRPTRRTLKRGRRSPRREDGRLRHAHTGLRRDVGLTGPVTSVAIGPVRPSPPSPTPSRALHHQPRHCGGTGRQDAATPAAVRPAASRQPHPQTYVWATTKWEIPTTPPSKPLLDGYRARHDAPPYARFARMAAYSTTLYTMPLHVDITVQHACKLPPPCPIKGGAVPQPQGEDGQRSRARFSPSPRYWHLTQSVPLGPRGPASSPASLVAPLCKHHGATQYSASSTSLLDVRPPAGTRISPVSLVV